MVINVDQCWSMYIGFSSIFVDFEVFGSRTVTKMRGKVDRRGKGRLGAQKNEADRVKETPERSPGASKVRFIGGQGAPKPSTRWQPF